MTDNIKIGGNDPLYGSFCQEDWERIALALKTFVVMCEGRDDYNEMKIYEGLARDIEMFIIPPQVR